MGIIRWVLFASQWPHGTSLGTDLSDGWLWQSAVYLLEKHQCE